ncbi:hypothetical protein GUJ93_ZPchr0013g35268 [Zizania palustris]|uniref:Uncharacterized protein n=1 Tax=Zizania palustris TaxID=103762 RepID=A0A8J5WZG2_ZIZPA|nr:hypothetical protein GUJ93_ZPchr0013g35268 [Zizania palustris]
MKPRRGLAHPSLSTCSHSVSTRPSLTRCGSAAASRRSASRLPPSSGATSSTSLPPSGSIRLARHRTPRPPAATAATPLGLLTDTPTRAGAPAR